jgi:hypothetical protein
MKRSKEEKIGRPKNTLIKQAWPKGQDLQKNLP